MPPKKANKTDENFNWVNDLLKKELIKECKTRGLITSGKVENIRSRLIEFLKKEKQNAATFSKDTSPVQERQDSVTTIYKSFEGEPENRSSIPPNVSSTPETTIIPHNYITTPILTFTTANLPQFMQPVYTTAGLQIPTAHPQNYGTNMSDNKVQFNHISDGDILDKVRKWNVKFDQGHDPLN